MKTSIFLILLFLINTPGFSQNILESLSLKDELFGEYVEGEATSTDTIIDLRNGYYEAYASLGAGDKTILRQAAIFHNQDGSRTLGISITSYDFVCYNYETHFYEIPKSRDSMRMLMSEDILPDLSIRAFLKDTSVLSVLNKYLPALQKSYLGPDATIDEVLSEIYDIVYLLPQRGTDLISTLRVCDYIPTNEVSIPPDDWSIIANNFVSIVLEYDNTRKKFKKR